VVALVRGFWSGIAFSVALVASLLGRVPEASACSPPPTGWFPSGVTPAPANGVVLLRYACYSGCETLPTVGNLLLKNEADALVPGSVVFSQARASELIIAFRPEPGAVTEGSVYTAELEGVPTVSGILVGPAMTWNDALTLTDEIFEVDYPIGETECCKGPIDLCGNLPCFHAQVDRRTAVTIGWYDPLSIEHYQYVFRIGTDGIDPAAPWSWDGGDTRFELDATEDSVCYVLELKRLADDSVQTFASRCVERPGTFTPGPHPTPEVEIAEVLAACDEPPDGYEAAWCEARKELCEVSPDEVWCEAFTARCAMTGAAGAAGGPNVAGSTGDGGAMNSGGTTSSGGTAGAAAGGTGGGAGSSGAQGGTAGGPLTGGTSSNLSGAGGTGEAGAPDGEAGEAGEAGGGKRVLTKGCGCAVPGNGSREPASLALVLALAALGLRRATSRSAGRMSSRR
jgi:MYXO-CTERM domain-containing protein